MKSPVADSSQSVQSYQYSSFGSLVQPVTVFCDFDGPIVDVSERYYCTYHLALTHTLAFYQAQDQSLSLQPLSKQQFWQMKQDRVCDLEIAMRSGLSKAQIPVFLDYVEEIVNHPDLLHKDKIQPGVNWALALLHSQGVKLVLVTLRAQEQVQQILNDYGLKRLFSGIYGSTDARIAYHNNADYKTHLLKTAIAAHPSEIAYMVGDTEADILAAQAVNIPVIALTCGIRSASYLKQFAPDQTYQNLLFVAHYILGISISKF
jgi:phosphoglycolate phosphatase